LGQKHRIFVAFSVCHSMETLGIAKGIAYYLS